MMNNMNIWKRIKIWFDPDHRLTVKHMTKNKVFEVASFNSKKDTRLSGTTIDGKYFLLKSETPMEYEIIQMDTSDKAYKEK
jgi:hypothetical protein|tara:strand:- start:83 stop:325 length:243 start_codon:yes stop_codon:yes gene_type:complete